MPRQASSSRHPNSGSRPQNISGVDLRATAGQRIPIYAPNPHLSQTSATPGASNHPPPSHTTRYASATPTTHDRKGKARATEGNDTRKYHNTPLVDSRSLPNNSDKKGKARAHVSSETSDSRQTTPLGYSIAPPLNDEKGKARAVPESESSRQSTPLSHSSITHPPNVRQGTPSSAHRERISTTPRSTPPMANDGRDSSPNSRRRPPGSESPSTVVIQPIPRPTTGIPSISSQAVPPVNVTPASSSSDRSHHVRFGEPLVASIGPINGVPSNARPASSSRDRTHHVRFREPLVAIATPNATAAATAGTVPSVHVPTTTASTSSTSTSTSTAASAPTAAPTDTAAADTAAAVATPGPNRQSPASWTENYDNNRRFHECQPTHLSSWYAVVRFWTEKFLQEVAQKHPISRPREQFLSSLQRLHHLLLEPRARDFANYSTSRSRRYTEVLYNLRGQMMTMSTELYSLLYNTNVAGFAPLHAEAIPRVMQWCESLESVL